jgi:hypothetical protein
VTGSVTELLSRYYCLYDFIYAINRPRPTKVPYTFTLASVVPRVKTVWLQSGRWYQQKTKKGDSLAEAEDSVPRRKGWSGIFSGVLHLTYWPLQLVSSRLCKMAHNIVSQRV